MKENETKIKFVDCYYCGETKLKRQIIYYPVKEYCINGACILTYLEVCKYCIEDY